MSFMVMSTPIKRSKSPSGAKDQSIDSSTAQSKRRQMSRLSNTSPSSPPAMSIDSSAAQSKKRQMSRPSNTTPSSPSVTQSKAAATAANPSRPSSTTVAGNSPRTSPSIPNTPDARQRSSSTPHSTPKVKSPRYIPPSSTLKPPDQMRRMRRQTTDVPQNPVHAAISELYEKLQMYQESSQESLQQLQTSMENKEEEIEQLKKDMLKKDKEMEDLKMDLDTSVLKKDKEMEDLKMSIKVDIAEKETEMNLLRAELGTNNAKREKDTEQLRSELKTSMAKQEEEIDVLKSENLNISSSVLALTMENKDLVDQLKSLRNDNKTLVDIIEELNDKVPENPTDLNRLTRLQSTENYILLKEDLNKLRDDLNMIKFRQDEIGMQVDDRIGNPEAQLATESVEKLAKDMISATRHEIMGQKTKDMEALSTEIADKVKNEVCEHLASDLKQLSREIVLSRVSEEVSKEEEEGKLVRKNSSADAEEAQMVVELVSKNQEDDHVDNGNVNERDVDLDSLEGSENESGASTPTEEKLMKDMKDKLSGFLQVVEELIYVPNDGLEGLQMEESSSQETSLQQRPMVFDKRLNELEDKLSNDPDISSLLNKDKRESKNLSREDCLHHASTDTLTKFMKKDVEKLRNELQRYSHEVKQLNESFMNAEFALHHKLNTMMAEQEEDRDMIQQTMKERQEDHKIIEQMMKEKEKDCETIQLQMIEKKEDYEMIQKSTKKWDGDHEITQQMTKERDEDHEMIQKMTKEREEDRKMIIEMMQERKDDHKMIQQSTEEREKDRELMRQTMKKREEDIELIQKIVIERKEDSELIQQMMKERKEDQELIQQTVIERKENHELMQQLMKERKEERETTQQTMKEREKDHELIQQTVIERKEDRELMQQMMKERKEDHELIQQSRKEREEDHEIIQLAMEKRKEDSKMMQQTTKERKEECEMMQQTMRKREEDHEMIKEMMKERKEDREMIQQSTKRREENRDLIQQTMKEMEEDRELMQQTMKKREEDHELVQQTVIERKKDSELIQQMIKERKEDQELIQQSRKEREEDHKMIEQMMKEKEKESEMIQLKMIEKKEDYEMIQQSTNEREGYGEIAQQTTKERIKDLEMIQKMTKEREEDHKMIIEMMKERKEDREMIQRSTKEREEDRELMQQTMKKREEDHKLIQQTVIERKEDRELMQQMMKERIEDHELMQQSRKEREEDHEMIEIVMEKREEDCKIIQQTTKERKEEHETIQQTMKEREEDHELMHQTVRERKEDRELIQQMMKEWKEAHELIQQSRKEREEDHKMIKQVIKEKEKDCEMIQLKMIDKKEDSEMMQQSTKEREEDGEITQQTTKERIKDLEMIQKITKEREEDHKMIIEMMKERKEDREMIQQSTKEREEDRKLMQQTMKEREEDRELMQQTVIERKEDRELFQQMMKERKEGQELIQQSRKEREEDHKMIQLAMEKMKEDCKMIQQTTNERKEECEMIQQTMKEMEEGTGMIQQTMEERRADFEMIQQMIKEREGDHELIQQTIKEREKDHEMIQHTMKEMKKDHKMILEDHEMIQKIGKERKEDHEMILQTMKQREQDHEMIQQIMELRDEVRSSIGVSSNNVTLGSRSLEEKVVEAEEDLLLETKVNSSYYDSQRADNALSQNNLDEITAVYEKLEERMNILKDEVEATKLDRDEIKSSLKLVQQELLKHRDKFNTVEHHVQNNDFAQHQELPIYQEHKKETDDMHYLKEKGQEVKNEGQLSDIFDKKQLSFEQQLELLTEEVEKSHENQKKVESFIEKLNDKLEQYGNKITCLTKDEEKQMKDVHDIKAWQNKMSEREELMKASNGTPALEKEVLKLHERLHAVESNVNTIFEDTRTQAKDREEVLSNTASVSQEEFCDSNSNTSARHGSVPDKVNFDKNVATPADELCIVDSNFKSSLEQLQDNLRFLAGRFDSMYGKQSGCEKEIEQMKVWMMEIDEKKENIEEKKDVLTSSNDSHCAKVEESLKNLFERITYVEEQTQRNIQKAVYCNGPDSAIMDSSIADSLLSSSPIVVESENDSHRVSKISDTTTESPENFEEKLGELAKNLYTINSNVESSLGQFRKELWLNTDKFISIDKSQANHSDKIEKIKLSVRKIEEEKQLLTPRITFDEARNTHNDDVSGIRKAVHVLSERISCIEHGLVRNDREISFFGESDDETIQLQTGNHDYVPSMAEVSQDKDGLFATKKDLQNITKFLKQLYTRVDNVEQSFLTAYEYKIDQRTTDTQSRTSSVLEQSSYEDNQLKKISGQYDNKEVGDLGKAENNERNGHPDIGLDFTSMRIISTEEVESLRKELQICTTDLTLLKEKQDILEQRVDTSDQRNDFENVSFGISNSPCVGNEEKSDDMIETKVTSSLQEMIQMKERLNSQQALIETFLHLADEYFSKISRHENDEMAQLSERMNHIEAMVNGISPVFEVQSSNPSPQEKEALIKVRIDSLEAVVMSDAWSCSDEIFLDESKKEVCITLEEWDTLTDIVKREDVVQIVDRFHNHVRSNFYKTNATIRQLCEEVKSIQQSVDQMSSEGRVGLQTCENIHETTERLQEGIQTCGNMPDTTEMLEKTILAYESIHGITDGLDERIKKCEQMHESAERLEKRALKCENIVESTEKLEIRVQTCEKMHENSRMLEERVKTCENKVSCLEDDYMKTHRDHRTDKNTQTLGNCMATSSTEHDDHIYKRLKTTEEEDIVPESQIDMRTNGESNWFELQTHIRKMEETFDKNISSIRKEIQHCITDILSLKETDQQLNDSCDIMISAKDSITAKLTKLDELTLETKDKNVDLMNDINRLDNRLENLENKDNKVVRSQGICDDVTTDEIQPVHTADKISASEDYWSCVQQFSNDVEELKEWKHTMIKESTQVENDVCIKDEVMKLVQRIDVLEQHRYKESNRVKFDCELNNNMSPSVHPSQSEEVGGKREHNVINTNAEDLSEIKLWREKVFAGEEPVALLNRLTHVETFLQLNYQTLNDEVANELPKMKEDIHQLWSTIRSAHIEHYYQHSNDQKQWENTETSNSPERQIEIEEQYLHGSHDNLSKDVMEEIRKINCKLEETPERSEILQLTDTLSSLEEMILHINDEYKELKANTEVMKNVVNQPIDEEEFSSTMSNLSQKGEFESKLNALSKEVSILSGESKIRMDQMSYQINTHDNMFTHLAGQHERLDKHLETLTSKQNQLENSINSITSTKEQTKEIILTEREEKAAATDVVEVSTILVRLEIAEMTIESLSNEISTIKESDERTPSRKYVETVEQNAKNIVTKKKIRSESLNKKEENLYQEKRRKAYYPRSVNDDEKVKDENIANKITQVTPDKKKMSNEKDMEVKEDVDKATSILMENVGFKKQIVKKDEQNVENIVTKNKTLSESLGKKEENFHQEKRSKAYYARSVNDDEKVKDENIANKITQVTPDKNKMSNGKEMEVKEDIDKATSMLMKNVGAQKLIVKKDASPIKSSEPKEKHLREAIAEEITAAKNIDDLESSSLPRNRKSTKKPFSLSRSVKNIITKNSKKEKSLEQEKRSKAYHSKSVNDDENGEDDNVANEATQKLTDENKMSNLGPWESVALKVSEGNFTKGDGKIAEEVKFVETPKLVSEMMSEDEWLKSQFGKFGAAGGRLLSMLNTQDWDEGLGEDVLGLDKDEIQEVICKDALANSERAVNQITGLKEDGNHSTSENNIENVVQIESDTEENLHNLTESNIAEISTPTISNPESSNRMLGYHLKRQHSVEKDDKANSDELNTVENEEHLDIQDWVEGLGKDVMGLDEDDIQKDICRDVLENSERQANQITGLKEDGNHSTSENNFEAVVQIESDTEEYVYNLTERNSAEITKPTFSNLESSNLMNGYHWKREESGEKNEVNSDKLLNVLSRLEYAEMTIEKLENQIKRLKENDNHSSTKINVGTVVQMESDPMENLYELTESNSEDITTFTFSKIESCDPMEGYHLKRQGSVEIKDMMNLYERVIDVEKLAQHNAQRLNSQEKTVSQYGASSQMIEEDGEGVGDMVNILSRLTATENGLGEMEMRLKCYRDHYEEEVQLFEESQVKNENSDNLLFNRLENLEKSIENLCSHNYFKTQEQNTAAVQRLESVIINHLEEAKTRLETDVASIQSLEEWQAEMRDSKEMSNLEEKVRGLESTLTDMQEKVNNFAERETEPVSRILEKDRSSTEICITKRRNDTNIESRESDIEILKRDFALITDRMNEISNEFTMMKNNRQVPRTSIVSISECNDEVFSQSLSESTLERLEYMRDQGIDMKWEETDQYENQKTEQIGKDTDIAKYKKESIKETVKRDKDVNADIIALDEWDEVQSKEVEVIEDIDETSTLTEKVGARKLIVKKDIYVNKLNEENEKPVKEAGAEEITAPQDVEKLESSPLVRNSKSAKKPYSLSRSVKNVITKNRSKSDGLSKKEKSLQQEKRSKAYHSKSVSNIGAWESVALKASAGVFTKEAGKIAEEVKSVETPKLVSEMTPEDEYFNSYFVKYSGDTGGKFLNMLNLKEDEEDLDIQECVEVLGKDVMGLDQNEIQEVISKDALTNSGIKENKSKRKDRVLMQSGDGIVKLAKQQKYIAEKGKQVGKLKEEILYLTDRLEHAERLIENNFDTLSDKIDKGNKQVRILQNKMEKQNQNYVKDKFRTAEEKITVNSQMIEENNEKITSLYRRQEEMDTRNDVRNLTRRIEDYEKVGNERITVLNDRLENSISEIKTFKDWQLRTDQRIDNEENLMIGVEQNRLKAAEQIKGNTEKIEDLVLSITDTNKIMKSNSEQIKEEVKTTKKIHSKEIELAKEYYKDDVESLRENYKDIEVRVERVTATKILVNSNLNEMIKRVDSNFEDIQLVKEHQYRLDKGPDVEKIVDRVLASERLGKDFETYALSNKEPLDDPDEKTDVKSVIVEVQRAHEQINILKHKQKELCEQYNLLKINERIEGTEERLLHNIQEIRDEIRSNPLSSPEKQSKGKCCKERNKEDAKRKEEIKKLKGHVENIEHLLFKGKSQNLELKWVFSNYHHYSRSGEPVFSPIFYSQLNGNRFQLGINWSGAEKGFLEVNLYLHHGKNVQPLDVQCTVGIVNQTQSHSSRIDFKNSEDNLGDASDSSANQQLGEGKKRQLSYSCQIPIPSDKSFVYNDTITVYCAFDSSEVVS